MRGKKGKKKSLTLPGDTFKVSIQKIESDGVFFFNILIRCVWVFFFTFSRLASEREEMKASGDYEEMIAKTKVVSHK